MRRLDISRAAFILLLITFATPSLADKFPGYPLTPEIKALQEKADFVLEKKRYKEAYPIYLNDLAPMGDKFTHYAIGWMHLHGLGVEEDIPLGVAWVALAAERGDIKLVAARDEFLAQLNDQQREEVQGRLGEIRAKYGDCVLLGSLLAEAQQNLKSLTGSRLAGTSQPVTVIEGPLSREDDLPQRYLRGQIRLRKRYLRKHCRE